MPWDEPLSTIRAAGAAREYLGYITFYRKDTLPVFYPQDGTNEIRIVQPIEIRNLRSWAMPIFYHRNLGTGNENGDYICPSRMSGLFENTYDEPWIRSGCPVCAEFNHNLWDTNRELYSKFNISKRYLVLIINDQINQGQVYIWPAPYTLIDRFIMLSNSLGIDVSDPYNCFKLTFRKTGTGLETRYSRANIVGGDTVLLSEGIADQRLEFRDMIEIPSAQRLRTIMDNMLGRTALESETEESTPRRLDI